MIAWIFCSISNKYKPLRATADQLVYQNYETIHMSRIFNAQINDEIYDSLPNDLNTCQQFPDYLAPLYKLVHFLMICLAMFVYTNI